MIIEDTLPKIKISESEKESMIREMKKLLGVEDYKMFLAWVKHRTVLVSK